MQQADNVALNMITVIINVIDRILCALPFICQLSLS
ncbi:Uncharacterised protein [Yersinia intermedia]|nr:Uncharacterised protein [Yersinia intermedia]